MHNLTMRELREKVENYTVFYSGLIKRDGSLVVDNTHITATQRAADKMLEVLSLIDYVLEEAIDAGLRRLARDLRVLVYAFEKKICGPSHEMTLLTRFLTEKEAT